MERAQQFFEKFIEESAKDFFLLAQSGSARRNFVGESSDKKYIITENEHLAENESFYYFSKVFTELNLNTPKIYSISDDRKIYVQEFLGSNTLSEIISSEGLSERVRSLVKKTLQKLFTLQNATKNKIDFTKTFEYENYDELPITNDLFYFKSFILDALEIPYHKASLLSEFKILTQKIAALEPKGLMIRDFQARNIMVNENDDVFFIDYQSAMKGPLMYDVISFLYQAKANFPEEFKLEMLDYYFSLFNDTEVVLKLKNSVKYIQLIRFMQVLGAYGFRGLVQKKQHFLSSLHQGIENLSQLAVSWDEMKSYPELKSAIATLNSGETTLKINEF